MDLINHPISGEKGYFCTIREKVLIDAILIDFKHQFVLHESSPDRRGVVNE